MSLSLLDPRLARCRRLYLRDWELDANIGVYAAERKGTQPLLINIDVWVELAASTPRHDRLDEVLDYDAVRAVVLERIGRGHINLQETLVDEVLAEILRRPGVVAARVTSEKSGIYGRLAGIGVEVFGFREGA